MVLTSELLLPNCTTDWTGSRCSFVQYVSLDLLTLAQSVSSSAGYVTQLTVSAPGPAGKHLIWLAVTAERHQVKDTQLGGDHAKSVVEQRRRALQAIHATCQRQSNLFRYVWLLTAPFQVRTCQRQDWCS